MARKIPEQHYFECNLPRDIPTYYHPDIYQKLKTCVAAVYARTEKLNAACDRMAAKGMRPATFHTLAKVLFDNVTIKGVKPERFDNMAVADLCKAVDLLYNGEESPDRLDWPNAIVLYDTAFVSTKDWEALRHFGIGGSDSSVLMGVCPYQTEEGLWYDKTGYPELVSDEGRQAIFDRGHFLEPKVIEAFCNMTGAEVIPETRMFQSKKHPHSTANLDAVLRMTSGKIAIFEAKSAIDCWTKIEEWLGENVPPNYVTQTHQYLGVMDDPRIDGVYIGMLPCTDHTVAGIYIGSEYDPSKYFHHFIERDEAYEEEILSAEDEFWANYVETGIKPAPSKDSELDKQTALRYRPSPISDPTIPTAKITYDTCEELYQQLIAAEEDVALQTKKLDSLTNYRNGLRNELIELMDGAQEAILEDASGEPLYTVKNTRIVKEGVDMTLLKQIDYETYKKCRKEIVYTKFSTKPFKKKK